MTVKPFGHPLQRAPRQERGAEPSDIGQERHATAPGGNGAKEVVLDRVTEDDVRALLPEGFQELPAQAQPFERV